MSSSPSNLQRKSGSVGTVMNFVKPFIGAGILTLPSAWSKAGWLLSSITLIVQTYVAAYAIFALSECSEFIMLQESLYNARKRIYKERNPNCDDNEVEKRLDFFTETNDVTKNDLIPDDTANVLLPTMSDVGGVALGTFGRVLTDVFIVISQFGACVAYAYFISDAIHVISKDKFPRWAVLLTIAIPTIVFCLIRNISRLSVTSMLGNAVYVYLIICCIVVGVKDGSDTPISSLNLASLDYYPNVFSTISFALEGIAQILPVKEAMKNQQDFKMTLSTAMCIIAVIYLFFSVSCYFLFGDAVKDTSDGIITNQGREKVVTKSIQIALSLALFCTIPIQLFPASSYFDKLIDSYLGINVERDYNKMLLERKGTVSSYTNDDNTSKDRNLQRAALSSSPSLSSMNIDDYPVDVYTRTDSTYPSVEELYPQHKKKRLYLQNFARITTIILAFLVAVVFPRYDLIVNIFGSFIYSSLAYILPMIYWMCICRLRAMCNIKYYPYNRQGQKLPYPKDYVSNTNEKNEIYMLLGTLPTMKSISWLNSLKHTVFPLFIIQAGLASAIISFKEAVSDVQRAL